MKNAPPPLILLSRSLTVWLPAATGSRQLPVWFRWYSARLKYQRLGGEAFPPMTATTSNPVFAQLVEPERDQVSVAIPEGKLRLRLEPGTSAKSVVSREASGKVM